MPIIRATEQMPPRAVITVIYGSPGSGKTSFACTSDNPILIDTDRGADRAINRPDTVVAHKWEDVLDAEKELNSYKTNVIDTAKSALDDFLLTYVVKNNPKLRTNKLKAFGEIADQFKIFINNRRSGDVNIVLVCHAKEEKKGDDIFYSPDVTGSSKELLMRIADQIGYMHIVSGKRVIDFAPNELYVGKDTAGLGQVEVLDCSNADYKTSMQRIIQSTKDAIQATSEAQKEALKFVEEMSEAITKIETPEQANEIITKLIPLPVSQKKPLSEMLMPKCTELGFVFDKESKTWTKPEQPEVKPEKTKKEK